LARLVSFGREMAGPELGYFVFGYFVKDRMRGTANAWFAMSLF
jgi:hypothetical protein